VTRSQSWGSAFRRMRRILEILDTPEESDAHPELAHEPPEPGTIEFRNVTFGYEPTHPILKNINLRIEPGQMIGIVGRSGGGKSSLINLLCRFYEPQEGTITIGGTDIREFRAQDIRRMVGLVLQEPFLFRGSIIDNIAYGRPDADLLDILPAAKSAQAHEFIMRQPQGYETELGERGTGLSGGERQRISIARALLCNPPVLVLDEATSSVDSETEFAIQKLAEGRTVIAIAHRLSTLRNSDCIYVVDNGPIVEDGTHQQLMDRKGYYFRMVDIQNELLESVA